MKNVADQLRKIAEKTRRNENELVQETNLQLCTLIILKTPVREGTLRGSWIGTIGRIPEDSPIQKDKSGSLSIRAVQSVISNLKAGEVFTFTSNLPYAKPIEDGGSKTQAPQGMVRTSIRDITRIVENKLMELK